MPKQTIELTIREKNEENTQSNIILEIQLMCDKERFPMVENLIQHIANKMKDIDIDKSGF